LQNFKKLKEKSNKIKSEVLGRSQHECFEDLMRYNTTSKLLKIKKMPPLDVEVSTTSPTLGFCKPVWLDCCGGRIVQRVQNLAPVGEVL
jgi:hypothetical protein